MTDKLAEHHSIADWDASHAWFTLDMARYVSPPTSVRSQVMDGPSFLCRRPATLCLPQGRMRCQVWTPTAWHLWFTFRSQSPLGTSEHRKNNYLVEFSTYGVHAALRVNFVTVWAAYFVGMPPYGSWINLEVTWWNYPIMNGRHPLAISAAWEQYGIWHNLGRVEDENGRWHDSDINRVGIYIHGGGRYFDDTEIYAPI